MGVSDEQIEQLRRFNRTVTRRIGVLHDSFLGSGRPLGESRLLFEIGIDGAEVRALRKKLDLDSGYASRLLRSLEDQGLVLSGPAPGDARVSCVQLTEEGLAELTELNDRSNAAARDVLSALNGSQRSKLANAMDEVARLLRASGTVIAPDAPNSSDAIWCLEQYYSLLDERFEGGFTSQPEEQADYSDYCEPDGVFLIARHAGKPLGCVGLRRDAPQIGEIKRLWVERASRGAGLGQKLLSAAEAHAHALGFKRVRLDTNKSLAEARALYSKNGYREIPPYNQSPYPDYWFEKRL